MLSWEDVRRIALALPEAHESDHFGAPSFRVRKKIFASQGRDGPALVIKFEPEDQQNLSLAHPGLIEPMVGTGRVARAGAQGWSTLHYERCDEAFVAAMLKLAWSAFAPARLVKGT